MKLNIRELVNEIVDSLFFFLFQFAEILFIVIKRPLLGSYTLAKKYRKEPQKWPSPYFAYFLSFSMIWLLRMTIRNQYDVVNELMFETTNYAWLRLLLSFVATVITTVPFNYVKTSLMFS